MKNAKTNISLKPFIKNEIKELQEDAKRSRKRYKITAITLSILNLAMIAVAATAIDLLIVYHNKPANKNGSDVGVILTSFAAGLIVIMFLLQFGITIYRSKRKEDVYKDALDKIQLEVIKHHRSIGDYTRKSADKLLEERCIEIKSHAIEHKHKKSIGSLILKGLTGGEDA